MVGRVLGEPERHGKRIGWAGAPPGGLLVHLGMTGRWVRARDVPRHARLGLVVGPGASLWFVDPRRFGCVVPTERLDPALGHGLGPDALDLDPQILVTRLRGRRAVKVALMDQALLAGLGNIHATEALWRARLHPTTPCERIPDHASLAAAILEQLHLTLERDDGPDLAYITEGRTSNPFEVYGRVGMPCSRCGAAVERERLGGRATYWCPDCQA